MRFLLIFLGMLGTTNLPAGEFYVGTYTKDSTSKGIYQGQLDPATGALSGLQLASEAANPSYLALSPDGKTIYAVLEDAEPSVGAFRVGADGKLTPLGQLPSGGEGPCHVSMDRTGKFVFVANYTGGSIASFSTKPDGSLGERVSLIEFQGSGPDKSRQAAPHAHGIYPSADNRFVYACDLGTDQVRIFSFDAATGALAESGFASVPGGAGPRHLAFTPNGRFAYASNEMGLSVTAFLVDAKTGALKPMETVPFNPSQAATKATLAEIEVHPSGKWLYVSSRGDDTISVFRIARDGKLAAVENVSSGVKIPRGFAIDPAGKWLLVAGQDDNRLATFRIDEPTGKLVPTDAAAAVGKPVCIIFPK